VAEHVPLRDGPVLTVEREAMRVMYLEVGDEPDEIKRGWADFERIIGSMRGRKFPGTFDGTRYRACVQLRDEDQPDRLGLQTAVIPGGRFLRARLRDEPERLYERIPSAFESLEASASRDLTRPGIEFYRRLDEVDLLLPVSQ
jgi:hypothetical protein